MATKKHVAVVAFPFSSHPRTIMTLLLKMATSSPNILFSFFNTQKSNQSLLSSSTLYWPSNIKFYNVDDGVPLGHKFSGSPLEPLDLFLKVAAENLTRTTQTAAEETGINFTCIITDSFLSPFIAEIADKIGTSWIPVFTGLPCGLAAHIHTQILRDRIGNGNLDKDQNLDFIPSLSMMRVKDIPAEVLSENLGESGFIKTLSILGEAFPKAAAVAVSSFEELNPEPLNNEFRSNFKHFLNLGIIAQPLPSSDLDPAGCLPWLDRQQSRSVAYICFGTVAALPDKELQELAKALEISKIPFLWSLKDNLREKLPNGFLERTREQGKIVAWTPQSLVLEHNSVAVFISHSGYNAIRESIVCGVPMICRPMFGDQLMAARLVEDVWGIGVKVEDGGITKNGLLKSLEVFIPGDSEREKKIRENVQELKKVVLMASQPGGSAYRDFNKLIEIISTV